MDPVFQEIYFQTAKSAKNLDTIIQNLKIFYREDYLKPIFEFHNNGSLKFIREELDKINTQTTYPAPHLLSIDSKISLFENSLDECKYGRILDAFTIHDLIFLTREISKYPLDTRSIVKSKQTKKDRKYEMEKNARVRLTYEQLNELKSRADFFQSSLHPRTPEEYKRKNRTSNNIIYKLTKKQLTQFISDVNNFYFYAPQPLDQDCVANSENTFCEKFPGAVLKTPFIYVNSIKKTIYEILSDHIEDPELFQIYVKLKDYYETNKDQYGSFNPYEKSTFENYETNLFKNRLNQIAGVKQCLTAYLRGQDFVYRTYNFGCPICLEEHALKVDISNKSKYPFKLISDLADGLSIREISENELALDQQSMRHQVYSLATKLLNKELRYIFSSSSLHELTSRHIRVIPRVPD